MLSGLCSKCFKLVAGISLFTNIIICHFIKMRIKLTHAKLIDAHVGLWLPFIMVTVKAHAPDTP